jgi:hypothetical protein
VLQLTRLVTWRWIIPTLLSQIVAGGDRERNGSYWPAAGQHGGPAGGLGGGSGARKARHDGGPGAGRIASDGATTSEGPAV